MQILKEKIYFYLAFFLTILTFSLYENNLFMIVIIYKIIKKITNNNFPFLLSRKQFNYHWIKRDNWEILEITLDDIIQKKKSMNECIMHVFIEQYCLITLLTLYTIHLLWFINKMSDVICTFPLSTKFKAFQSTWLDFQNTNIDKHAYRYKK